MRTHKMRLAAYKAPSIASTLKSSTPPANLSQINGQPLRLTSPMPIAGWVMILMDARILAGATRYACASKRNATNSCATKKLPKPSKAKARSIPKAKPRWISSSINYLTPMKAPNGIRPYLSARTNGKTLSVCAHKWWPLASAQRGYISA